MGCSRGDASPSLHTKLKLFADSGGYCQNPSCNVNLFIAIGDADFHIAEMAHIISVGDSGPRANPEVGGAEKGGFENLIVLCPTCHTMIDKAEGAFPDSMIKEWKRQHSSKIDKVFGIESYDSRESARNAIIPILNENKIVFNVYGPMTDERFNPESIMPKRWLAKIRKNILPNNRKIVKIVENNYHLLEAEEHDTFELFKQHVLDFEAKHIGGENINGLQFPVKMQYLFHN